MFNWPDRVWVVVWFASLMTWSWSFYNASRHPHNDSRQIPYQLLGGVIFLSVIFYYLPLVVLCARYIKDDFAGLLTFLMLVGTITVLALGYWVGREIGNKLYEENEKKIKAEIEQLKYVEQDRE